MSPTMNSRSSPGPMTRLRVGWPSLVRSSVVVSAIEPSPGDAPRIDAGGGVDRPARAADPRSERRRPIAPTLGAMRSAEPLLCLVTGATGYIGGRLVPELLAAGHRVRVMTRNPDRIRDHPWSAQVEVARAD